MVEIIDYTKEKSKWVKILCPVCQERLGAIRVRWCCLHHIDGRRNSNRSIRVCSNANPDGVLYPDSCHDWIHHHVGEAKKLGYLSNGNAMPIRKESKKIEVKKKQSSASKWTITKKHSSPDKWKLDFSKKVKKKG